MIDSRRSWRRVPDDSSIFLSPILSFVWYRFDCWSSSWLKMDSLHSHRAGMISVAVALVAIGAGTAYYFYINKKPKAKGCLDPENYKEFKLVQKTQLSHNVAKFVFALPTPDSVLGLPIGQHMSCRGKDSLGEEVVKAYTPTTLDSDTGYFELVIKMYPQGRMSHHFREMQEGDFLSVKGPKGRFKYQPGQVKAFGMIAGGTGITPMFQVARAILENPSDKTVVSLIYANVTEEDILLKEELDSFARGFPDRFSIYYVLNQILRCGPPPMNKAMAAHLEDLGYTPEMLFKF